MEMAYGDGQATTGVPSYYWCVCERAADHRHCKLRCSGLRANKAALYKGFISSILKAYFFFKGPENFTTINFTRHPFHIKACSYQLPLHQHLFKPKFKSSIKYLNNL